LVDFVVIVITLPYYSSISSALDEVSRNGNGARFRQSMAYRPHCVLGCLETGLAAKPTAQLGMMWLWLGFIRQYLENRSAAALHRCDVNGGGSGTCRIL
jgi:hypothetical protein